MSIKGHLECGLEVVRERELVEDPGEGLGLLKVWVECTAHGVEVATLWERGKVERVERTQTWHLPCWENPHAGKMDSYGREEVAGTLVTFALEDGRHAVGLALLARGDNHSKRGGRTIARQRCLREAARARGELKPSDALRPTKFGAVMGSGELKGVILALKKVVRMRPSREQAQFLLRKVVGEEVHYHPGNDERMNEIMQSLDELPEAG